MRVGRQFSLAVQYVLDQWVPPVIRDSKLFMYPSMKLLFRDRTADFMSFKDVAFGMNDEEFADVYRRVDSVPMLQGETDLNQRCIHEIRKSIIGGTVLEAGAGRGYLAGLLSDNFDVTATDIVVSGELEAAHPRVTFRPASVEALPFADDSFDTVVCTHTLEHVQDLRRAIIELRRVAKQRLIIVVPRQRPYKYGYNLHLHFFPYAWSIQAAFGIREKAVTNNLGDWYYHEDRPHN